MAIDDATGAIMKADLAVGFSAKAEGGPVAGAAEVHAELSEVAATAAIERPAAEELVAVRNCAGQVARLEGLVIEIHPFGKNRIESDAAVVVQDEAHPPPEPARRPAPRRPPGDHP